MQCPHCGYLNRPADPVCAQCGTWLPAASGVLTDPLGVGGGMAGGMAGGAHDEGYPNAWAPRQSAQVQSAPVFDPSAAPADPAYPERSQALIVRPSSALDIGFGSPALASQPLGMGTLLKGGRYRLVQPYSAASGAAASESEPPLMIASDTEVPNTRVLVQELPFGNLSPEDAEQARQALTQRLIALSHVQGLARLVDGFSERRRHFLVSELPTGDLLSDRLRRAGGRLSESTAVSTALQALDVLDELDHELPPVTHGNICPAHIVLRPGGRVALVGISPTLLLFPDGHTLNGPAAGMPGYAAPEQSRGQASPRADLFAVCAVLYAAVTGAPPMARATALYQPARHANPEVSLELEEVLSKGLRPSPSQRYQSAADLRADLAPIASGRRTRRLPEELAGADASGRVLVPLRDERGHFIPPRQPLLQNPIFLVACVVALVVIIGGAALYALQPHTGATGTRPDSAVQSEAAELFMTQGIGLSGGEYVFDPNRSNNGIKQQAERAVAAGDQTRGIQLYEQALGQDPSDAEAAIYAADLHVLQGGHPYVTVVAAVAFGAAVRAIGEENADARSELQGVYLAQQRINATGILPGGVQVRALILNSNKEVAGATAAAHLIQEEMRAGNAERLVGIVGWPESDQSRLAISALAPSGLAIVSPTASADGLGGTSSSFFPLVPPDSALAGELADAARQLDGRRIVAVSDPNDQVSANMAAAFTARIRAQYASAMTVARRETFTKGAPSDFNSIVGDALSVNADLIYLAGDADAALNLALAVQQRLGPGNTHLRILVGPQADTPALLGLGDSPTASLARTSPGALASLYVATLATPGAWDAVQAGATSGVDFAGAYTRQFGESAGPDQRHDPNATVLLSYDATNLLAAATRQALGASKALSVSAALAALDPTAIRTRLRGFDESHPFVGIGGATGFTVTGPLPKKAIAILRFAPNPAGQTGLVAQPSVAFVVGGRAVFCAPLSCQLTL